MGKRGPAPKPSALRLLEGTARADRMRHEPQPPVRAPSCPTWLHREARREWRRLTPLLVTLGLVTDLDRSTLAGYCQSYARWYEAEGMIAEEGMYFETESGYKVLHPAISVSRASLKAMTQIAAEFGFSPASRTRIGTQVPPAAPKTPMELLLEAEA